MNNHRQRAVILTLIKIMIIRVKMIFKYFILIKIFYRAHIEQNLIHWLSFNHRKPRGPFEIRFFVQNQKIIKMMLGTCLGSVPGRVHMFYFTERGG